MKRLKNILFFAVIFTFASCQGDSTETGQSKTDENVIELDKRAVEKLSGTKYISYTDAKLLIANYQSNGSDANFDYNGSRITGFHFTRQDLQNILAPGSSDSLFLMWCLDTNATDDSLYLNLIIAPIDNGSINQNILGQPSQITTAASMSKEVEHIRMEEGSPISHANVEAYLDTFVTSGSTYDLMSSNNQRVKGYTLDQADINALDIFSPTGSPSDIFAFIPIIRPVGSSHPPAPAFNHPFLSVAVGQVSSGGAYIGNFRDYLKPCPSVCMNYGNLFND